MKISPARSAAFEILLRIEREKAFSSILLPYYEERLDPKDRALCHQITLGVLRTQLYLDRIIAEFAPQKLDAEVRIALRIGLYQLLFLDKIPAYSAINESVNLVVKAKKRSAKGFVNAILRRATREIPEFNFIDEIDRISVESSHPRALLENWVRQFGFETTKALAGANNEVPALDFRRTAKTSDETYPASAKKVSGEALTDVEPERVGLESLRNLAVKGEIYFQDAASQLVGRTVQPAEGERFLDVCAAPGSKLTQIASAVRQTVFGGDLHRQRVVQIRKSARQQGVDNIAVLQYDAERDLPFADETFDIILVDAPCSGTGTIRHNPEIRYQVTEKDFAELSHKQLKILENASKALKRGGRLIYSTCSVERAENEEVIEKFLADHANFVKAELKQLEEFRTNEGFVRTFPHSDGMDGFFVALLLKD